MNVCRITTFSCIVQNLSLFMYFPCLLHNNRQLLASQIRTHFSACVNQMFSSTWVSNVNFINGAKKLKYQVIKEPASLLNAKRCYYGQEENIDNATDGCIYVTLAHCQEEAIFRCFESFCISNTSTIIKSFHMALELDSKNSAGRRISPTLA